MIAGNTDREIIFSIIINDFDDKGYVTRAAQAASTDDLNFFIERATVFGRKDIAEFLKKVAEQEHVKNDLEIGGK